MVSVLNYATDTTDNALDGSYRIIEVFEDRFEDKDGDLPLKVVDDSWSFDVGFPGTWLDYKNGIFYSPDFKATEPGVFKIFFTIEDSAGVQCDTYITFEIVEDEDEISSVVVETVADESDVEEDSSKSDDGDDEDDSEDEDYHIDCDECDDDADEADESSDSNDSSIADAVGNVADTVSSNTGNDDDSEDS